MNLETGLVQVYTGNGKGKTTAAIGQGMRCYGNGFKVIMVQFLKSGETGELNTVKELNDRFTIYRFEKEKGFTWTLSETEKIQLKSEIKEAINFIYDVIEKKSCDMLIIDEIMGTLHSGYIKEEQILDIIKRKPEKMELILTGRNVPKTIIEKSDLVTEMKDIKHYFNKGINARKGIEY